MHIMNEYKLEVAQPDTRCRIQSHCHGQISNGRKNDRSLFFIDDQIRIMKDNIESNNLDIALETMRVISEIGADDDVLQDTELWSTIETSLDIFIQFDTSVVFLFINRTVHKTSCLDDFILNTVIFEEMLQMIKYDLETQKNILETVNVLALRRNAKIKLFIEVVGRLDFSSMPLTISKFILLMVSIDYVAIFPLFLVFIQQEIQGNYNIHIALAMKKILSYDNNILANDLELFNAIIEKFLFSQHYEVNAIAINICSMLLPQTIHLNSMDLIFSRAIYLFEIAHNCLKVSLLDYFSHCIYMDLYFDRIIKFEDQIIESFVIGNGLIKTIALKLICNIFDIEQCSFEKLYYEDFICALIPLMTHDILFIKLYISLLEFAWMNGNIDNFRDLSRSLDIDDVINQCMSHPNEEFVEYGQLIAQKFSE